MKKILTVSIIVLLALSCVFAEEASAFSKAQKFTQSNVYRPVQTNRFNHLAYELWENPAELAGGKFALDLLEIGVSVNNIADILSDAECRQAINNIDLENGVNLANKYIEYLGNGTDVTNEILKLDLGLGNQMGGFAFRFDTQVKLNTYNESGYSQLTGITLIPEVNAAFSAGLGFKLVDSDSVTVKVGASAHATARVFTSDISAKAMMSLLSTSGTDIATGLVDNLKNSKLCLAVGMPVDASVSVGFVRDQIKVYAQANNLWGDFSYVNGNYEELMAIDETTLETTDTFTPESWKLNFGASFKPDNWRVLVPSAYVELVDMYSFTKEMLENKSFDSEALFAHFNCGAQISILNMIKVAVGYQEGYRQIAASVGINDINVQATYGAHTYNNNVEDTLSVLVKLGLDFNR